MKKKSIKIMIFIIIVTIGIIFLISFEKNQVEEETINTNISKTEENLTTVEDKNEIEVDNKGYEIPSLDELSKTEKFMNTGYIISMKVFLRINQILNMSIDEINKTEKEIKGFEDEFNALEGTKDTELAERILEELFAYGYEAIDLYLKRLNGEEVKSIVLHDKISKAQEKYFAFAKEFDNKKTPMSREVIQEVIEIREEIKQNLKDIENRRQNKSD